MAAIFKSWFNFCVFPFIFGNICTRQQTTSNEREVEIKVQGPRPGNIQFLIHEVIEGLVHESFHGVHFDFYVPCRDCLATGNLDPCMFAGSRIRRAIELSAPFMQCYTNFHTLSITELQSKLPPSSNQDFDLQLELTMRNLSDLRRSLSAEAYMLYCLKDVENSAGKISPIRIRDDLVADGLKVRFQAGAKDNVDEATVAMKDAQIVLVLMSEAFMCDEWCTMLLRYCMDNLRKPYKLVLLDKSNDWKLGDLGFRLSSEIFVGMYDPKRYEFKLTEVKDAVRAKKTSSQIKTRCFISYCWKNSRQAASRGTKTEKSALGWGDPREIKNYLEEHGIPCWLDIEQMGKQELYKDIAEGLKNAKVVVCCVSEEYVKSKSCTMEFEFASVTLKLPVILCVVGTGYQWVASNIGMLSRGLPQVNFQFENNDAYRQLMHLVEEQMPHELTTEQVAEQRRLEEANESNKTYAFYEMVELAERKFLRHLINYANDLDVMPFPRLLMIDFLSVEEKLKLLESHNTTGSTKLMDNLNKKKSKRTEKRSEGIEEKQQLSTTEENRPDFSRSVSRSEVSTPSLCFRLLCEFEEGWHVEESATILWNEQYQSQVQEVMSSWAPYLCRLVAILRNTHVDCQILYTEEGQKILDKMEEACTDDPDFSAAYKKLYKVVIEEDIEKEKGSLHRCHLPNGKVMWLCTKHVDWYQQNNRITILGTDDLTSAEVMESEDDRQLVENIQELLGKKRRTQLRGKFVGAHTAIDTSLKYANKFGAGKVILSRDRHESIATVVPLNCLQSVGHFAKIGSKQVETSSAKSSKSSSKTSRKRDLTTKQKEQETKEKSNGERSSTNISAKTELAGRVAAGNVQKHSRACDIM